MHTLEQHALDGADHLPDVLADEHDVLRADDDVHRRVLAEAEVHAREFRTRKLDQLIVNHRAAQQVAFADEVRDEGVCRFVVDGFGVADLLDGAVLHDDNRVGHGQRFLLVMGDEDERNAQPLLHGFQFQLHFLAKLQVKRAQRLVQQENLRLVDQTARNRHALLLATRKRVHMALFVPLQVHQLQHLPDFFGNLLLRQLLQLQSEGDVVVHVQVREERVFLEDRVDAALVGRQRGNILPAEEHLPLRRRLESADDAQRRRLAAARRPKQGNEFLLADVKVDILQNLHAVKLLRDADEVNQMLFLHHGGKTLPSNYLKSERRRCGNPQHLRVGFARIHQVVRLMRMQAEAAACPDARFRFAVHQEDAARQHIAEFFALMR